MSKQSKEFESKTTIRIMLQGYGGECFMGRVNRSDYDFFKKKRVDITQYAQDSDDINWKFIPKKHQFFPPGNPFDSSGLGQQTGANMDDESFITIEDENRNKIWKSGLSLKTLKKNKVSTDVLDDITLESFENGQVIFWGGQGEKGIFLNTELKINAPFDPEKLKILYSNFNGWRISATIEYADEEIDANGYDTYSQWSEYKFLIAGDEEVYEGECR